jgi:hypothetical protein
MWSGHNVVDEDEFFWSSLVAGGYPASYVWGGVFLGDTDVKVFIENIENLCHEFHTIL